MPSQRFDDASLNALSPFPLSAPLQMSSYAAPFTQGHILEAGTISPTAEWPEQKVVDIRSVGRGVRWALTIECAAALCIYASWRLWLFWR
jgi:hypothetical protein